MTQSGTTMNGYMVDSNVFNRVMDDGIPHNAFQGLRMFATHVQLDELNATSAGLAWSCKSVDDAVSRRSQGHVISREYFGVTVRFLVGVTSRSFAFAMIQASARSTLPSAGSASV
jgi:hypothetical protein